MAWVRALVLALALAVGVFGLVYWKQVADTRARDIDGDGTAEDPELEEWLRQPKVTYERDLLVLYLLSKDDVDALDNFEFFISQAMHSDAQRCQYVVLLRREDEKALDLPRLPSNAQYLIHRGQCSIWGTFAWGLQQVQQSGGPDFKYFFFTGSRVRGPFVSPAMQGLVRWWAPFVDKLDSHVKLVGPTVSCEALQVLEPVASMIDSPHVQPLALATDKEGLELLRNSHSLDCPAAGLTSASGSKGSGNSGRSAGGDSSSGTDDSSAALGSDSAKRRALQEQQQKDSEQHRQHQQRQQQDQQRDVTQIGSGSDAIMSDPDRTGMHSDGLGADMAHRRLASAMEEEQGSETSSGSSRKNSGGGGVVGGGAVGSGDLASHLHVGDGPPSEDEVGHVSRAAVQASLAVMDAGYSIACLMARYRGLDWTDKANWGCNDRSSPAESQSNDGVTLDPYEVIFIGWGEQAAAAGRFEFVPSPVTKARHYSQWIKALTAGQVNATANTLANVYLEREPMYRAPKVLEAIAHGFSCFDASYYRAHNQDLAVLGSDLNLWRHYVYHGQFEPRAFRYSCPLDYKRYVSVRGSDR